MVRPPTILPRAEPQGRKSRAEAEIDRLVGELRELGALKIVLFGSRATGRTHRSSDTDLLVVMPEVPGETFPTRVARVWDAIRPRVSVDLLVYTEAEIEDLESSSIVVREALTEGRVLHAS